MAEIPRLARRTSSQLAYFPLERILDAADGVLNLTLNFVSVAFRLQLGVADRLADHLLDCALDLLRRSDDPVLVHNCILRCAALNGRIKLQRELMGVVDLNQHYSADDFRIDVNDSGLSVNCVDRMDAGTLQDNQTCVTLLLRPSLSTHDTLLPLRAEDLYPNPASGAVPLPTSAPKVSAAHVARRLR